MRGVEGVRLFARVSAVIAICQINHQIALPRVRVGFYLILLS